MTQTVPFDEDRYETEWYEIRIKGHLNDRWAVHFDGMTITREENGITCLAGPVADQATLHGLLRKVRDAGMTLHSINPVEPGQADDSAV